MGEIKIKTQNAISAYNDADAKEKRLLEKLLGKETFKIGTITERVTTPELALQEYGSISEEMDVLINYDGSDPDMISASAYVKLVIITKVLNEGWVPDWDNPNEPKYMPVFKHKSGFGLSFDGVGYRVTTTNFGSRLCFKTRKLAEYAATQFAHIYNDYLTIK